MHYIILTLVVLSVINNNFVFAQTYTYSPIQTSYANINDNTTYPKIDKIERIVLKKIYSGDNINIRLNRLERKLFAKTFQDFDLAWRVDNILSKVDRAAMYDISSRELAEIERKVLNRSYSKEDISVRISRLEQKMFGTMQNGGIKERYTRVKTAALSYESVDKIASPQNYYYSQYPNNTTYTSSGNNGGFKNTFRNALGFLTGQMTGFTPPIYPSYYNNTVPYNYGNNAYPFNYGGYGLDRGYMTNNRFFNSNAYYGTGSGVTILD